MKSQCLVSVLMPAFNSEEFIATAIESVLKSTYTNFELIITDDNSTDNTFEIAKSYSNKDCRVKVFLNEKNYGDYPNRNRAASYANGKYLKYVDHDDFIYPHGLEQLVFYMEQFPDAGYGLCSMDPMLDKPYPIELSPQLAYATNYFEMALFIRAPLSSIIRKKAFDEVGGFSGKPYLGDFELWHLLSQTNNVVLMPGGIVWYRKHENQESRKVFGKPEKEFDYLLLGEKFIKSSSCPLNEKEREKVLAQYKNRKVQFMLSTVKHYSLKHGIRIKHKGNISWNDVINHVFKNL